MVSGYMFDTCLISETGKPVPDERVQRWLRQLPGYQMWTSVIVFGELQSGICLLDEGARRRSLVAWLARQRAAFGERCLPVDEPTARAWGELHAARQRIGRPLTMADGLIAATAIVRGLAIATRNIADFEDCGAQIVNPWIDK
jgi:predicted nucleic acid-binding protein